MPHCTTEHPLKIINVFPRGGTHYVPSGVMHIDFCYISTPASPYVHIVLRQPSTGQEWVVGERISSVAPASSNIDWEIPSDILPGSGYQLEISEAGGSARFTYDRPIAIREP